MKEAVEFLRKKNKYGRLIRKWEETKNQDYGFEILVFHQCETNDLQLSHEVSANEENEKTVDFSTNIDGVTVNMELVRIGLNKGIREPQKSGELQGYVLNSDASDPDFRTGAQVIKLQWGLLEKVQKFAEPNNETINLICVDCTNVHAGMLDQHDVAVTMWGKAYNPICGESWEGNRILGILEPEYSQRGSEQFKTHVSAVVFVEKLKYQPLDQAYIAINNLLGKDHSKLVLETLKKNSAFTSLKLCPSI